MQGAATNCRLKPWHWLERHASRQLLN